MSDDMRPRKGDLYLCLANEERSIKLLLRKDKITPENRRLFDRIDRAVIRAFKTDPEWQPAVADRPARLTAAQRAMYDDPDGDLEAMEHDMAARAAARVQETSDG